MVSKIRFEKVIFISKKQRGFKIHCCHIFLKKYSLISECFRNAVYSDSILHESERCTYVAAALRCPKHGVVRDVRVHIL